jgi:macrodomain Ter protein organizer (MatP/YcbG family)
MKIEALQINPEFQVEVKTTSGRGFTPEETAEMAADKIISISDEANPVIRDQAKAFRKHIVTVLAFYMRQAIKSDRTTVYNALKDAGHKDLAELIRRM